MHTEIIIATISVLMLAQMAKAGGGGGHHKKVIIHVPYKVKTIHHTHTVYKHIGKDHEDDNYKVIGYSGGIDKGREVSSHVGGGGFGGGYGGGYGGGHAEESNHENVGYEGYSGGHAEISSADQGYDEGAAKSYGGYEGGDGGYSHGYSGGYGGGELMEGGDYNSYESSKSSYDVSPYSKNYESYDGHSSEGDESY